MDDEIKLKIESIDWLIEQSRKSFDKAWDEKNKFRERVSFVSGVFLIPVGGAIFLMASTYKGDSGFLLYLFYFGLMVSSLLVLFAVYNLLRVLIKPEPYQMEPISTELFSHIESFDYNLRAVLGGKEAYFELLEEATENNVKLNADRVGFVSKAQTCLCFSIPFVIFSAFPYTYYAKIASPEEQKVRIVNELQLKEVAMSNPKVTPKSQPSPKAVAKPQASDPAKKPTLTRRIAMDSYNGVSISKQPQKDKK